MRARARVCSRVVLPGIPTAPTPPHYNTPCKCADPHPQPSAHTTQTTKTPLKPLKKPPDDGGQRRREANKLQLNNRPNLSNRNTRPKIHQGVEMMLAAEK